MPREGHGHLTGQPWTPQGPAQSPRPEASSPATTSPRDGWILPQLGHELEILRAGQGGLPGTVTHTHSHTYPHEPGTHTHHIHSPVRTHAPICAPTYTSIHRPTYTLMHIHTCTYHGYTHVDIHMHKHRHTAFIPTSASTLTCAHMYTHMHRHMHTSTHART